MTSHLEWADWLAVLAQFATLSLLSIGGAITTVPDMHRFLVDQRGWLTDVQFASSIALAQAAPGPNVLFVALLGWQMGLNAAGGAGVGWLAWPSALLGVAVTLVAILLPSSLLTYGATRWVHHNRQRLWVRAFKSGLAPVVVGLMLSTAWLLSTPSNPAPDGQATPSSWLMAQPWSSWALSVGVAVAVWRTRVHLLWLLGAGALLGAWGWA